MASPKVVVIAGPNGAGKSTVCEEVASRWLGVRHYVNADVIARGLSAFGFDDVAFDAGKVMLERVRKLAEERSDFGFETTLASRSFATMVDRTGRIGICLSSGVSLAAESGCRD